MENLQKRKLSVITELLISFTCRHLCDSLVIMMMLYNSYVISLLSHFDVNLNNNRNIINVYEKQTVHTTPSQSI